MKKKIMLFSEGVTLSQVVRLVTLGRSLDPALYDVTFACSDFDEALFRGTTFRRRQVHSLDPKAVHRALRSGRRLYDRKMLLRQVDEDLAVFDVVRPDLVVGDFRWSLAVSAPVFGVPHAALINAYWSPYVARRSFPVPDHPIVRVLGETMTARYFPIALPRVFEHFAAPLNEVRRAHGLPPAGSLLEVLTHGDFVLYADPPELVPTVSAPPTHEHLGFVPWAPEGPLPPFWSAIPADRPVVYATVGSSGDLRTLPRVVEALGRMKVTGLVATAARTQLSRLPDNVHAADFLPGDLAARRSGLVISNGGSSTSYQALAEGVPVLGIASNLDQYLAMDAIEASGAGRLLRGRTATAGLIRESAEALLESPQHHAAAKKVQADMARTSAADRFRRFVERVLRARARPGDSTPGMGARQTALSLGLVAVLVLAATLLGGGVARAEGQSPAAARPGEIRFTVRVPGSGGHTVCALFREGGWLKKPVQVATVPLRAHESSCVFMGVQPGTYAIVAFHDENDNGDIDTNFIGIPTEDWCTSRNARAIFGPPTFGAAKFLSRSGILRLTAAM